MKDDNNKNLEEFFNRSLEDFNDGPSGQVWEGLAERLEEDMTFFQRLRNRMSQWLPILLLLLLTGTYYFFTQQKLDELKSDLQKIEAHNQSLNTALTNCSGSNQDTPAIVPAQQGELITEINNTTEAAGNKSLTQSKLPSNTEEVSKKKVPFIAAKNNQATGITSSLNNRHQTQDDFKNANRSSNYRPSIFPNETVVATNQQEDKAVNSKENEIINNKKELKTAPRASRLKPLAQLNRRQSLIYPLYLNRPSIYGVGMNYISPINSISEKKRKRYSLGFEAILPVTVIPGIGNKNSIGYAFGIQQDYRINDNWSFTNAFHFYHQHYSIDNSALLDDDQYVQNYPSAPGFDGLLEQIMVSSSYLDASLGVKWDIFHFKKNGGLLFVNQSIVWQAYLPQNFKYSIRSGGSFERKVQRYVGYFGSTNLRVGIERRLTERYYYQAALMWENSFIPLGVENQKINMLGASFAFFFGE